MIQIIRRLLLSDAVIAMWVIISTHYLWYGHRLPCNVGNKTAISKICSYECKCSFCAWRWLWDANFVHANNSSQVICWWREYCMIWYIINNWLWVRGDSFNCCRNWSYLRNIHVAEIMVLWAISALADNRRTCLLCNIILERFNDGLRINFPDS